MTSSSEYEAKAEQAAAHAEALMNKLNVPLEVRSADAQVQAQLSTTYATLALVAIQRNRS